jgi:hypothetical protein
MSYSDSVIQAESGGDPNAANPNSSAVGAGQFITPTWVSLIKQHRPDLAAGKSDDEIAAMRADPALSGQMVDAYGNDNAAILAKNGLPVTDGSKYLAHFAGPQGAVKILQADPNAPAADILGPAAAKANPFLAKMTAQGLQAWAAKKAGVTVPTGGQAPQAAPQPQQMAAAQPALPQQPAPIFAQAPGGGGPAPAPAYSDPTPPPMPIFAPQRPQIDLSGLRAALARQPIFARG